MGETHKLATIANARSKEMVEMRCLFFFILRCDGRTRRLLERAACLELRPLRLGLRVSGRNPKSLLLQDCAGIKNRARYETSLEVIRRQLFRSSGSAPRNAALILNSPPLTP